MSEQNYHPITTVEEYKAGHAKMLSIMTDEDAIQKAEIALGTAQARGIPDASEYSLQSITAHDEEDLNLKMHLVAMPMGIELADGKMDAEEFEEIVIPILNAVVNYAMAHMFTGITFPATISIDSDEE